MQWGKETREGKTGVRERAKICQCSEWEVMVARMNEAKSVKRQKLTDELLGNISQQAFLTDRGQDGEGEEASGVAPALRWGRSLRQASLV